MYEKPCSMDEGRMRDLQSTSAKNSIENIYLGLHITSKYNFLVPTHTEVIAMNFGKLP